MAIHVTPIPSTLELAVPAFVLTTANSAGDASTAVASNSDLLMFDASNPAAVAESAAVGSATVASRRDHGHAGIAAITSTDEAITRYNSTGGQVQNYASLAPTISDAGIISLTSGALKFPASQIASTDNNTLDDYQIGLWTPTILDGDLDASEGQGYGNRLAQYIRIGDTVYYDGNINITNLGTLSGGANIGGLPFAGASPNSSAAGFCIFLSASGMQITAGTSVTGKISVGNSHIALQNWDAAAGTSALQISELSADCGIYFAGYYRA